VTEAEAMLGEEPGVPAAERRLGDGGSADEIYALYIYINLN
jgi:hypothetical protein